MAARKQSLSAFRHARALRLAEERLPFADLVRAAQSDRFSSPSPLSSASLQDRFVGLLGELKRETVLSHEVLVPNYAHPAEGGGRGVGMHSGEVDGDVAAWLPQEFAQTAAGHLTEEYSLERYPGGGSDGLLAFLPFVDVSYSRRANNASLSAIGATVLHHYARSASFVQIEDSFKECALELVCDANLASAFAASPSTRFVLTDIATARVLGDASYYGSVLGSDVLRHYPDEGGVIAPEEADAVRTRVLSGVLQAVVGHVYLDRGLDAAILLIEEHFMRRLLLAAASRLKDTAHTAEEKG